MNPLETRVMMMILMIRMMPHHVAWVGRRIRHSNDDWQLSCWWQ